MLCRTWCTWKFSARMILETPRKLKFLGGFTLLLNLQSTPTFGKKFMLVWSKVTRTHWWIGGVGCTTKHSCKDIVLYKTSYWTKMIYHYNIIWYYSYILNKNVPSIFCIIRTVVEIWKKKNTTPYEYRTPSFFFSFHPTLEDITSNTSSSSWRVKSCFLFGKGLEVKIPKARPSFRPLKIYKTSSERNASLGKRSFARNFRFASSRIELVSCLRKSGR